jgi:hypothetical protein
LVDFSVLRFTACLGTIALTEAGRKPRNQGTDERALHALRAP